MKPYEALNEECCLFYVLNRVFSAEFQGVETGCSVCVSLKLSETAGCSVFVSLELSETAGCSVFVSLELSETAGCSVFVSLELS